MGRLMRIGAVLMGVVLMVMTGGLGVLRAASEPPPAMVILIEEEYGKQYYALFEPQSGKIFPITPTHFTITSKGISPDGHWLYFVEARETEENSGDILGGRLRRVALTLHPPADQLLLDGINFRYTKWSPDFKWLLYVDNPEEHLLVANPLTGERRILTNELPSNLRVPSHKIEGVVFDGEWVLFSAVESMGTDAIYYRVRLDGTGLEHIGNVDGINILFDKPKNGNWYIGNDVYGDNFYRISADLQEAFVIDSRRPTLYNMEFSYWLTEEIVLLNCQNEILTYDTVLAVRMTDGQILWMVDHVVENRYLPHDQWVFLRRYDFTNRKYIAEIISVDGTERREVPVVGGGVMDERPPMSLFDWNSDADWWFYTFYNFTMGRFELHRLSADWQTDEMLWTDKDRLFIPEWQRKNLIFGSSTGGYTNYLTGLYQLDSDTLAVKRIIQPTSHTWIVDINGPNIERNFQPVPLVVVGVGLMGALFWGRVNLGVIPTNGRARRPTPTK